MEDENKLDFLCLLRGSFASFHRRYVWLNPFTRSHWTGRSIHGRHLWKDIFVSGYSILAKCWIGFKVVEKCYPEREYMEKNIEEKSKFTSTYKHSLGVYSDGDI